MYKVVIDAGHGGYDNGATYNGRREKDDVLEMSYLITNALAECGIETIMTRSNDVFVPLGERARIANDIGADLFLSIHRNSSPDGDASGVEVWIHSNRPKGSVKLANNVLEALLKTFDDDRGVHAGYRGDITKNFAVNRLTKMPSALVEFGFINSPKDNEIFDENKEKIAKDVADAVLKTLGVKCMPVTERSLIVKDGVWNVRAEPYGTVVGKVSGGEEYNYTDYKDNFYKIPMGWISEQGVILENDGRAIQTMATLNYNNEGHLDNYYKGMDGHCDSKEDNREKKPTTSHRGNRFSYDKMNRDMDNKMKSQKNHGDYEENNHNHPEKVYDRYKDESKDTNNDKKSMDENIKMGPQSMTTIKIKYGKWNVRKTPHSGKVTGIVYGSQVYKYSGTVQGWYKIKDGYLSPTAIDNIKNKRDVVEVKDGKWNVRKEPDLKANLVGVVGGIQMLEFYEMCNDFYKIDGGYIHKNSVK